MDKRKQTIVRGGIYVAGLLVLAMGIMLNTKSGLGVSPIISVPYAVSQLGGWNFGNFTLLFYLILVALQWVLRGRQFRLRNLLQIPLSLVFTRFLNLFGSWIPTAETPAQKGILLALGVVLTGIGAAMSVDVRLIPNPGDGIVQAVSDRLEKNLGLCKNLVDIICVLFTVIVSLAIGGRWIGIGIGTLCAMLGTGRVIYFFNRWFGDRLLQVCGVDCKTNG